MIAGAHDLIDLGFVNVNFLAAGSDAPAPLIILSIALQHGVPSTGFLVKKRIAVSVVFNRVLRLRAVKRTRHSGEGIGPRDLLVAAGARVARPRMY
jgi:hypothetical protein